MVAKITTPQNVRRALNYNEQKVKKEKAKCIHAQNFLKDADQMNFHEKLNRFQKQIELNQRAKTNSLHISLNFDLSDKIDPEKMIAIANAYMNKIGFGDQPYLVYQHYDAGHPHCHIVTTNIKADGKRIDTFNIGKKISEPARKAIEKEFELVKAEGKASSKNLSDDFIQKVVYGKSETKRAITNVLDTVLDRYRYGSLAELNAILRIYNIEADPGKPGSRIHDKTGLHYRIIDQEGKKIGVPIKASSIYSKPTLESLEHKFLINQPAKTAAEKQELKTRIDWTFSRKPETLIDFIRQLKSENIDVVLRKSDQGRIYGLTYVDHNTYVVFNGSDLGKRYSAKGVEAALRQTAEQSSDKDMNALPKHDRDQLPVEPERNEPHAPTEQDKDHDQNLSEERNTGGSGKSAMFSLLDDILKSEQHGSLSPELREEEKRKRRNRNVDQQFER